MEKPHRGEISEQHRRSVLEQLWLMYCNDTLYEQYVITEDERNKMRIEIKSCVRHMER